MTTTTPVPLLSPAALAEELDIPVQTIYRWRTEGRGPLGIRVGRHVRFRRAEVDAWLDALTEDGRTQR